VQKQETVFFVDRCLGGKRLPESLRLLGIRVEIHDDHFAKDALDKDWLPQVASKKWIIFTKDTRIGFRNLERLAVASSGARLFVLVAKNADINTIIQAFSKSLPTVMKFLENNQAPFIAKIYKDGAVSRWQDCDELKDFMDNLLDEINHE